MALFGPIPLPGLDKKFGDVMDFWNQLQKQKAQREQAAAELAQNAPLKQAQTQHALAQANRENQLSSLPFGGHLMPGPAGRALALHMIKAKEGEDSDLYKAAKKAYDLEESKTQQTIDYQKSLMESQPKRYATTAGKTAQELSEIDQGFMPGTTSTGKPGVPLTPEQQQKLKGQYNLKQLKDSTDSSVRQRILYSKNMEKTLDNINVDDLVSYSGIKGTGELLKDKYNAAQGNITPRYEKYKNALTAAETLAKQVRQFYGDSITAGVQEGLKKLTNPAEWLEHPKVAKSRFEAFKKILQTEAKTFTDAARNADIYADEPSSNSDTSAPPKMVKVKDKETGQIIEMTMDEYKKLTGGL